LQGLQSDKFAPPLQPLGPSSSRSPLCSGATVNALFSAQYLHVPHQLAFVTEEKRDQIHI
jgi:hypothetical protein